jgi:hypothetical protein
VVVEQLDDGTVRVLFTVSSGECSLSDALVLPIEQYAALAPQDLDDLIAARLEAWVSAMNAPAEDSGPDEDNGLTGEDS